MANRRPLVSLQSISAKECTRISTHSDTSFQDSHEMRINHRMKIKPAIMAPSKKKTGRVQLSQDSTYDGQPKAVCGNGKRPRMKRMRITRVVDIRISRKDLNNHVHLANTCATRCVLEVLEKMYARLERLAPISHPTSTVLRAKTRGKCLHCLIFTIFVMLETGKNEDGCNAAIPRTQKPR